VLGQVNPIFENYQIIPSIDTLNSIPL